MNGVCWCICRIPRKSTLLESFLFFRTVEWNRQRETTDTCFTRSLQNMLHSGEVDQVFFERARILQRDNMYLDWNSNTSKYYIRGTLCVWGNGTGGCRIGSILSSGSRLWIKKFDSEPPFFFPLYLFLKFVLVILSQGLFIHCTSGGVDYWAVFTQTLALH